MDSCFSECRRAHKSTNLQCQRLESPIEVQGQGDCKCNSDFQRTPKFWMSSDDGKKFKTKIREENESESKPEDENNFSDSHYDCFLKRDHKYNQEKDFESFKNLSTSWNSPYSRWVSQTKATAASEPPSRNQHADTEVTYEKLYEFQQKVEFLYRIFKDYEQKFSQGHGQSNVAKAVGGVTGNVFHLFNLNTRMCTVEEGIGKLASIVEDILKDAKKGKMPLFPEESLLFSDPSNFEDMNMTQRVNYLKNKNHLLTSLIKSFFNADSIEDIRSRMTSLSKDYEFKKQSPNSDLDFEEERRTKDSNVEEVMESLKKLKKQMADVQSKKCQIYEQTAPKIEKKEEPVPKFQGQDNRLEVISEQAELAFSEDTEPEADEIEEKNLIRNFKEKLSEFKEKFQENNMSGHDLSTRLSAQEAELLNSSLKKFQFELFSSLDTAGKKVFKTNMRDPRISGREELKRQTKRDESGDRLSGKVEIHENPIITIDINRNSGKFQKQEESTEAMKAVRNSFERATTSLGKQDDTEIGKKLFEQSEGKINLIRKIPQKNAPRMLPCNTKGKRGRSFAAEDRSPMRESSRSEEREERQRPATEPRIPRKSLPPSLLKPPVPEYQKKNSGIHNVKNKNKILLSKKPFVQTP